MDQINKLIKYSKYLLVINAVVISLSLLITGYSYVRPFNMGKNVIEFSDDLLEMYSEFFSEERYKLESEVFELVLRNSNKFTPREALDLAKLIVEESESYGIDPLLVVAVIKVESEFKPKALSQKGARGLMQVMPATGKHTALKAGIEYYGKESLFNPHTNVRLGIRYLSTLLIRYKNISTALAAYNMGPNKPVLKTRDMVKSPPRYVKKVLGYKIKFESIVRRS